MVKKLNVALMLPSCFFLFIGTANASSVLSAQSVIENDFGVFVTGSTDESNMINGLGLVSGYTSGVTNWEAYFAGGGSLHQTAWTTEWFGEDRLSNQAAFTGDVTFDLGSVHSLSGLALWNEDSYGIKQLDVYSSVDGSSWALVKDDYNPSNNTYSNVGNNYGADLLNWSALDARYIRLSIDLPGYNEVASLYSVSIGEIAFKNADPVPEPATLGLLSIGLAGLVGRTISKKRRK